MSDLRLFSLQTGSAKQLKASSMALQKSLQMLIVTNLETFLGGTVSGDGAQVYRLLAKSSAKAALKEMVHYDSEFSSVSKACIRKNALEPLIAAFFDA